MWKKTTFSSQILIFEGKITENSRFFPQKYEKVNAAYLTSSPASEVTSSSHKLVQL